MIRERLVIFQPKDRSEQARFFEELEDLLASLDAEDIPPSRIHSVVHNTRSWMALIITEEAG